jgi:putative hydrolase of HD superfamily
VPADLQRLSDQIAFVLEIDQLKTVLRQTPIGDSSRQENTAEHSWHLALAAIVLAEHANEAVDVAKVVEMLLIHDLVEIDAGDTFVYNTMDAAGRAEQEAREELAAERIFALLPPEQGAYFRALWDEFESKGSAEARFAKAVDRLQPMLLNRVAGGGSWMRHGITADKTRALIDAHIPQGSVTLAAFAHDLVNAAVEEGVLLPAPLA